MCCVTLNQSLSQTQNLCALLLKKPYSNTELNLRAALFHQRTSLPGETHHKETKFFSIVTWLVNFNISKSYDSFMFFKLLLSRLLSLNLINLLNLLASRHILVCMKPIHFQIVESPKVSTLGKMRRIINREKC